MSPFKTFVPEIEMILDFMQIAIPLTQHVQANLLEHKFIKDDRSPVTIGDYAVQALLSALLLERFPNDLLVGEESAASLLKEKGLTTLTHIAKLLKSSFPHVDATQVSEWINRGGAESGHRVWTLDPIDGTKGFLRGDQFAIALALVVDGVVQVAAIGCPNLSQLNPMQAGNDGQLVLAVKGEGSWARTTSKKSEFKKLSVSETNDIKQMVLLRSFETMHTDTGRVAKLIEAIGATAPSLHLDSLAKHALLAAGTGDAMIRFPSSPKSAFTQKIWDYAPGVLIIEEAGGIATDLDGKPYDFSTGRTLSKNQGLVAANQALHPQLLAAIKALG